MDCERCSFFYYDIYEGRARCHCDYDEDMLPCEHEVDADVAEDEFFMTLLEDFV